MRESARGQSGQGSVEFILFTVFLVLALALVIQFSWIGVQKWQFNHFAGYAARTWSVHTDESPSWIMNKTLLAGTSNDGWDIKDRDYVKLIWFSDEDAHTLSNGFEDVDTSGLTWSGLAMLMPLFRPYIGGQTLVDVPAGLQSVMNLMGMEIPPLGIVRFEVYIPIERVPEESSGGGGQKFDNDCDETPCDEPNGR